MPPAPRRWPSHAPAWLEPVNSAHSLRDALMQSLLGSRISSYLATHQTDPCNLDLGFSRVTAYADGPPFSTRTGGDGGWRKPKTLACGQIS